MDDEIRTWLGLVFALDLEDIKEVGGDSVDLYQVLVGLGNWVGELYDFELGWGLPR